MPVLPEHRGFSDILIYHVHIVLIINPRIGDGSVLRQVSARDKSTAFTILKYGFNLGANSPCNSGSGSLCVTGHTKVCYWSCVQRYFTAQGLSFQGWVFWMVG